MTIDILRCSNDINVMPKTFEVIKTINISDYDLSDFMNITFTISDSTYFLYFRCVYAGKTRYFYVTKYEHLRNGAYRISAHEDVLQTFQDEIKELTVNIVRDDKGTTSIYNDNTIFTNNYSTEIREFTQQPFNTTDENQKSYILTLSGGEM